MQTTGLRLRYRPHLLLRILRVAVAADVWLIWANRPGNLALAGAIICSVAALLSLLVEPTVFDEDGVHRAGGWWRRHHRWEDLRTLGVRRGDNRLTLVLADGRRRRLSYVPATAYDRLPAAWLARMQHPTTGPDDRPRPPTAAPAS